MKKLILLTGVLAGVFIGGHSAYTSEVPGDPDAIMGGGMVATKTYSENEVRPQLRYAAGGGDFDCGVTLGMKVVARYDHRRLTHSATAKNGWGGQVRDKQSAGVRAFATCNASLSGNTGWWNTY